MDEAVLDPELASLAANAPAFELTNEFLAAARRGDQASQLFGPQPLSDAVERTDHVVEGDPNVVIRVHRPKGMTGLLPCVYSIHGGGYVLGSYEMDDPVFDRWCPELGCVGVSVEYRLAPETSFPGPLEDCYAGLRFTAEHADELGVDARRIGIMGTSAGGGLAAALALMARDRGEVPVQFQILDSPMLDDRQSTASSRRDGMIIWSRSSNTFGWKAYLGDLYGAAELSPYAAAARATDLSGLPPAFIIVGGADGFRDEDIVYALRLGEAGVPTELHVLPGAPHGVQLFIGTEIATRYNRLKHDGLRRALEQTR